MGKDHSYEFEELFNAYESCKINREPVAVHTCKGYVHFVPSGQLTVKVFITDLPDFDALRDTQVKLCHP